MINSHLGIGLGQADRLLPSNNITENELSKAQLVFFVSFPLSFKLFYLISIYLMCNFKVSGTDVNYL